MNKTTLIGFLIIVVLIILGVWYASDDVFIESDFGTKIVYTTDMEADRDFLENHCLSLGGEFNECGSICGPDADVCADVCAYTCENIPQEGEIDTSTWQEYQNNNYGFSLIYPADDWNIEEDTSFEFSPKFNFYLKPAGVPVDLPLDHFANVTHLSVYPLGIPTEGLIGEREGFDLSTKININNSQSSLFVLEDGTPFAAFIKPQNPPQSWNESGFIWMRLRAENLETRCEIGGEPVEDSLCEPPIAGTGNIIRTGNVDAEEWEVLEKILENFDFIETISTDLIRLNSPERNEVITSPVSIAGEARGQWYFEASFPVVLTDWDGRIIAEGNAQAQGDWMTENFVPFNIDLEFDSPYTEGDPEFMKNGSLILQKSNPSGLPENDDALEIPIRFAQ